MAMTTIQTILGKIQEWGLCPQIQRFKYSPYKMDIALDLVRQIGLARSPRFTIDDSNRFVYENIIRWIHGDETMMALHPETKQPIRGDLNKGIFIGGNTGSGKSWCLEIMGAYTFADNPQVKMGDDMCMLRWQGIRTDVICDEYARTGNVESYKKRHILAIQDLGAEQPETMYMGNRLNVLQQIIESRGDRLDAITLITSNLPITHVKMVERYGERVASRLQEMCNYFEIKGVDHRKM